MTGLEAIAAHNGWAISAIGITIVFTGLTTLSIIIAQLHKVLRMWDDRAEILKRFSGKAEKPPEINVCDLPLPGDVKASVRQYRMLVERLGEPFALPKLLDVSIQCGLARPHSALNDLIQAKVIVPDGQGYYTWNQSVEK